MYYKGKQKNHKVRKNDRLRKRIGRLEFAAVNWELFALDIRNGIRFLKSKGIQKVILIDHSGGGPSTSYFQALATGDPRHSLEERYKDHDGYVKAVTKAAKKLEKQRFPLIPDRFTFPRSSSSARSPRSAAE